MASESKRNEVCEKESLTGSFALHRRRRRPRFYCYVPWFSLAFWCLLVLIAALVGYGLLWSERLARLSELIALTHCANIHNSSSAMSRCVRHYAG